MKKVLVALVAVAVAITMVIAVCGCGDSGKESETGVVTDDLGRRVEIEKVPERIVSVSPACTEILFALGVGDKVVGVTEYCDYPEEAKKKPKIGTFSTPNIESIVDSRPDLVLATGGVQREALENMENLGLTVYAVNPETFDQTIETINKVGRITGAGQKAEEITDDMEGRREKVEEKVEKGESSGKVRPKVFYEIYFENNTWTAGSGSIISDLITIAGGRNIGDVETSEYYEFSLEKLIAENPDVYLISSGSMSRPGDVSKRPNYDQIKAVKDGRICSIGEDLVYRTGPRLIDGLEAIYEAINEK